ncbi:MAG: NAD-dependent epimerase/dehydratase family protein, partial [Metallosphaera sp.]|uniref:NAD-dependent epimerase/dehydratase family protein n=1 Tax=Metallosphaera sp. TaxID=2020860 RepID=UPI0031602413
YREDEAYKAPSSPYAVSKIASEMLLAGRKEKTIILRPINTIGRPISLWPAKVNRYFFETTVLAILTGKREIHYNVHPNSSRQWMFYEDNINAYLHVIKNLDRMEGVYNVSPHYSKFNHALTLGEAFSIISKELGWEGKVTWLNNPRSVDPNYLLLNSDNIYRTGFDVDDSIVAIRKAIGSLKKEVEMLKASELKAKVQHGS